MNQLKSTNKKRSAMTLLELILALFIASLVMLAIGMAMQLQALTLDNRRNVVEEVQLARAILRQISDDLRSAARYEELTISDSSQTLSTDTSSSTTSATPSTGGTGGATTDLTDQASTAVDSLDVQNSTSTTAIPGIFGGQTQLQIDLSRLPRIDEYQPMLASVAGQMTSVPSGYRTVAYFMGNQIDPVTGAQTTGLMRRELDRTVTDYATKSGNLTNINAQGEILAAEVVNIQFRYFDGKQYLLQWDTATTTALPIAVEISLWLRPPVSGRAAETKDQTSTLYRMVVAIPTGEYPPDTSGATTTTDSQSTSGNSTGGGGAATGGATGGGGAGGGATGSGAGGTNGNTGGS